MRIFHGEGEADDLLPIAADPYTTVGLNKLQ